MKTNVVITHKYNKKEYYLLIMYDKQNLQLYKTDLSELYNCNCNSVKKIINKIFSFDKPCRHCYNILSHVINREC